MNEPTHCPTCGRRYPRKPLPRYATHEERVEGVRAQRRRATDAKAEADRSRLFPMLPDVFRAPDVGHALRKFGRHWSEHQGVMLRWAQRGWIQREVLDDLEDRRVTYQWRKVVEE